MVMVSPQDVMLHSYENSKVEKGKKHDLSWWSKHHDISHHYSHSET